jgi:hypothetical protein
MDSAKDIVRQLEASFAARVARFRAARHAASGRAMRSTCAIRALAIVAFLAIPAPAFADGGLLQCADGTSRGHCRLQWQIPDPWTTRVWIQRLSPDTREWIDVDGPSAHARDESRVSFDGGALYRVLGCRDDSRQTCTSTNVVWTPIWIDDPAKIPSSVKIREGVSYGVSKRAPLIDQLLQYNVYQLCVLVETGADMSKWPELRPANPAMMTFEDTVQANVYSVYMGIRSRQAAGVGSRGPADVRPGCP